MKDAEIIEDTYYTSPYQPLFIPLTTTKGEIYFLRASTIQGVDPFEFAVDHLDCPGHKGAVMSFILHNEVKVTGCKETPAQVAALLNGTAQ